MMATKRYALGYKARYFYTNKNYVFGLLGYETDEFASINNRTIEVLGYGRQFMDNENITGMAKSASAPGRQITLPIPVRPV